MKRGKRREIQQSGTGRVEVEVAIRMAIRLGFFATRADDKLAIRNDIGPIGWLNIGGDDCVSWLEFDRITGLGKPPAPSRGAKQ